MKIDRKKLVLTCFILSVMTIIYGYFLWTILIPIQDFHLMGDEELLRAQKEYALNYPLGRFLLYAGSFGLVSSTLYLIVAHFKTKKTIPSC